MKIYEPKIFRQETLDNERLLLIKKFKTLKDNGFYLAGGTALSLLFGHRQSIDFDFFCYELFDPNILLDKLYKDFGKENLKITNIAKNTLNIIKDGVQISFMTYQYPLIGKLINVDFFDIASIEDIAPMKMTAIQGRAVNKDYIDLYFIIKNKGLKNVLNYYDKKYGNNTNKTLLLKYLISFEDIGIQPIIMNKNISWEKIKLYLEQEVKNYVGDLN